MTKQQIELLQLGISPIDDKTTIIIASGLEWLKTNTTLNFNIDNDDDLKALPNSARLFLIKFFDVNKMQVGVTSQSIEGLSQSFDGGDKNAMLMQFAEELLSDYMISRVRFVGAKKKWR